MFGIGDSKTYRNNVGGRMFSARIYLRTVNVAGVVVGHNHIHHDSGVCVHAIPKFARVWVLRKWKSTQYGVEMKVQSS